MSGVLYYLTLLPRKNTYRFTSRLARFLRLGQSCGHGCGMYMSFSHWDKDAGGRLKILAGFILSLLSNFDNFRPTVVAGRWALSFRGNTPMQLAEIRADSGSHFVTRDPRDPSFSWPVTRMTRDPWPSPRPWHESITTTYESSWVYDYCFHSLQSRINVTGDWVVLS